METTNIAAVLGVGPGLGAAAARRFARAGYTVALMARKMESLSEVEAQITAAGGKAACFTVDASDAASVSAAFAAVRGKLGDPGVLVYNAGAFVRAGVLDLTPEQFETCWKANCAGAFSASREVVPAMLKSGRGTVIFTGATASLRGSAMFAGLAVGKFGLRALAQSLAREVQPRGIHVAHVIIDGQIDTPRLRAMDPGRAAGTTLDPEAIAETYWQLHSQTPTAWTHELELRPATEKW